LSDLAYEAGAKSLKTSVVKIQIALMLLESQIINSRDTHDSNC